MHPAGAVTITCALQHVPHTTKQDPAGSQHHHKCASITPPKNVGAQFLQHNKKHILVKTEAGKSPAAVFLRFCLP